MDACLRRMLNKTIHVASVVSYDGPQEILETPRAIKAYVEIKRSLSSDGDGKDIASSHSIITEEKISIDDRVWLPGFDQTNQSFSRQPVNVEVFYNEQGFINHYETSL